MSRLITTEAFLPRDLDPNKLLDEEERDIEIIKNRLKHQWDKHKINSFTSPLYIQVDDFSGKMNILNRVAEIIQSEQPRLSVYLKRVRLDEGQTEYQPYHQPNHNQSKSIQKETLYLILSSKRGTIKIN